MKMPCLLIWVGLALFSGCGANDTAVFVSKTSISIVDVDSAPPNISVAYNREEGYFGPRYESGAVPPILASIRSDGNILSPQVRQLYATGNAAEIAAGVAPSEVTVETSQLKGNQRSMFFGTSTTTGLKIDVAPNSTPRGLLFGFRRKEVSVIPLAKSAKAKNGQGQDNLGAYPSVIAAVDTRGASGREGGDASGELDNRQYFATGVAAEKMAALLRAEFLERAKQDAGATGLAQVLAAGRLLGCYAGVSIVKRPDVWRDAHGRGLLFDKLGQPESLNPGLTRVFESRYKSGC